REVLKAGTLGTLGLSLGQVLKLSAESAPVRRSPVKSVIILQKYGAPSQIDTWDMKPNAPLEIRGEFKPISTAVPGYFLSEHMPASARHIAKMTVVRSFGHRVANHNPATYFMLTGRTSDADIVQVAATP